MLKFHKLFNHEADKEAFHERIVPTDAQKDALVAAKNKIRDHLRTGITAASVTVLGMERRVEPRFRTQGSWSYRTCVQMAQALQQMDWDFGVYLPAKIWEGKQPKVAAKVYFQLVERLLKSLCDQEGWKLVTGEEASDKCIRIEIATWAHIDIPLYAAPEAKFMRILEKALARKLDARGATYDSKYLAESVEFGELAPFDWEDLDEIVLATRSGDWKPSDPNAVSKWFADRVLECGEQLRRICRYVKAWRDFQWVEGGPTSVQLMICVVRDFEPRLGRDDVALEDAMGRVAQMVLGEVREPGIDQGVDDFNRLKPDERADACARAARFRSVIRSGRTNGSGWRSESLQAIRQELGPRFPLRLDLVEADGGAATVRSTPAAVVAPPVVGSTIAG